MYLERLRRLSQQVSIAVKVTNQKRAEDIVAYCVKISKRDRIMGTDIRVVVFDCDAIARDDMEKAIALARKEGIVIAASNLCFEYWLLLHFEEPPMRLDSDNLYEEELSRLLGAIYDKSKGLGDRITSKSVSDAIVRSRMRLPSGDPMDCYNKQNSTCMHTVAETILGER